MDPVSFNFHLISVNMRISFDQTIQNEKKINPFPLTRPLDRDNYDKLSAQNPIKNATMKRLDTDYSPSDTYSVPSGFVFTLIDSF